MFSEIFCVTSVQACVIGLVAGLLAYWLIQKRRYNLPPGPLALPLLGNVLQMDTKFLHVKVAKEWAKKYGPVVSVRFGPILMVFVNNIESALEMLVKKSKDFAGRYHTPSLSVISDYGKDIFFGDYSPIWKLQRKIASKALMHYMQGHALERRIHQAAEDGLKEMEKEKGPFDPKKYINFIICDILISVCFGGRYDFNDKELHTMLEIEDEFMELFQYGFLEDFIPGLTYVYKTKKFKRLEELTKLKLHDFLGRKFDEQKKTFDRDNPRHFTDMLLLERLEAQEKGKDELLQNLTDAHLIHVISDIFVAGTDSSRVTLGFSILHMMAFPDIQTKVQEEIDRVVGRDRLPGLDDRSDLAYTEAVLHETMRLATVGPIGVVHMSTCDTELAGYRIPKGTQVSVNYWALHHDPDKWEDPERFIPERYLDENGRMGPKPVSWLPFSAGKRVCLGEAVAMQQLHLLFASLMQRFTWRSLSGTQVDCTPEGSMVIILPKECKAVITKRIQ